ncbi:MAG: cell envelope integrity protein CreD [Bacteroidales bacterium]
METQETVLERWHSSLAVKMIILALLGLLLLIPLQMVKKVIKERAVFAEQAKDEIAASWAAAQIITGPVLNVPRTKVIAGDGRYATTTLHILPDELKASATMNPEIRYRGIYESVVYDSDIELSGRFTLDGVGSFDGYTYDWSKAYISLGVSDNKGLKGDILINIDGKSCKAEPGPGQQDVFKNGISFPYDLSGKNTDEFSGDFKIIFGLKGSESLFFSPAGKTTRVNIISSWASPSFRGVFLPEERNIGPEGFTADWTVTHLNRSFPQAWTGKGYSPEDESFGVNLMMEVDHYKRAERSAKYGLLFILITFFVLIIIEVRSSERIHIFYYVLVAFALILFFSLLSALSEHVGFNPAYLIASVATIGLLTAFFRSLINKNWVIIVISGLLSTLYLFIFILLALKDYAYLAGNIGLFVLLAALMMVSSKYRIFSNRTI